MNHTIPALGILWCLFILAALAVAQEAAPSPAPPPVATPEGPPVAKEPKDGEVPLPAGEGWTASLVIDQAPTGIWTVKSFDVFPEHGCPEVVGLDDLGRCLVLSSYSGRWTPNPIIHDHKWLGGLDMADVDPRIPGRELYTGGQRGNLFQVVAYPQTALDCRLIAGLEGKEIHTIVARPEEKDLLVFTRPGGLYRVTPTGPDGRFETTLVEELEGRVRDAVTLPTGEIATVSRTGHLRLLRMAPEGPRWTLVHEEAMGMGRVAAGASGRVLYTTLDDGRVLRHALEGPRWSTETIHCGPQGPRGVAAGRFDADPQVETVAVFGYSGRVELLSRRGEEWKAETAFLDRDKGHWLAAAELDGRNGTHELLASGYGGRIVLLARPPGYGRAGPSRE
jgi:hypothetical protein